MCSLPAICAPANAHAIIVLRQASQLALWVGNTTLAASLQQQADGIEAYFVKTFFTTQCSPAAHGGCFRDADSGSYFNSTKLPSTVLALAAGVTLPTNTPLLGVMDFVSQRMLLHGAAHGLMGSPWLMGMLCQGLYTAAKIEPNVTLVRQAADLALRVLTADGNNSWVGMMCDYNATMTMEAWTIAAGAGTLSHPWNAAPAELVPRYLAGVQPLALGFESFIVAPLPATSLGWFNVSITIPQGQVAVSYAGDGDGVTVAVTVPGNTRDVQLCAPVYGLTASVKPPQLSLNGKVVDAPMTLGGGLLCVIVQEAGRYLLKVAREN